MIKHSNRVRNVQRPGRLRSVARVWASRSLLLSRRYRTLLRPKMPAVRVVSLLVRFDFLVSLTKPVKVPIQTDHIIAFGALCRASWSSSVMCAVASVICYISSGTPTPGRSQMHQATFLACLCGQWDWTYHSPSCQMRLGGVQVNMRSRCQNLFRC